MPHTERQGSQSTLGSRRASQRTSSSKVSKDTTWAVEAMQRVADTMINVTESFRQRLRDQYGTPAEPPSPPPFRPLLKARGSSMSSVDSSSALIRPDLQSSTSEEFTIRDEQPLSTRSNCLSLPHGLAELPGSEPAYAVSRLDEANEIYFSVHFTTPVLPKTLHYPRNLTQVSTSSTDDISRASSLTTLKKDTPQLDKASETPELPTSSLPCENVRHEEQPRMSRGFRATTFRMSRPPTFRSLGRFFTLPLYQEAITTEKDTRWARGHEALQKLMLRVAPSGRTFTSKVPCIAVICLTQTLSAAGFAQAFATGSIIGKDLAARYVEETAWYSSAYALGAALFCLPARRLAGIFGQRYVFMSGLIWLAVWSIIAGFGAQVNSSWPTPTAFFSFCRCMQGLSLGATVPAGYVMLLGIYEAGLKRDLLLSLYGAAAPLGFVLGSLISSLISVEAYWQWEFYLMAGICMVLTVVSVFALPSGNLEKLETNGERIWTMLDLRGMALSVAAMLFFNVGWCQVQVATWNAAYTYFFVIIGLLLFAAFIYLERSALYPILPLKSVDSTSFLLLSVLASSWIGLGVWIWSLVPMFEEVRGWSACLTSAAMIPLAVSGVAASFAAHYFLETISTARWLVLGATSTLFVGSILSATAPVDQTYWLNTFFSILVISLGIVMLSPAIISLVGHTSNEVYEMNRALNRPVGENGASTALSVCFAISMYALATAFGMAGAVATGVEGRRHAFENKNTDAGHGMGEGMSGYRAAQYLGLGVHGLGLLLASGLVLQEYIRKRRMDQDA